MRKVVILVGMIALLFPGFIKAEDQPAAAPASQPAVIAAGDKDALEANMDKEATVEGTISDAKWSSSGKVFLIKFQEGESSHFQAAFLAKSKEVMEKAFDGDLSTALQGAKVQVHGKLKAFHDNPEVLIDKPEQITILVKATGSATTAPTTRPAE
jgi:DNA/RNA endonuclease YhcR with UshA esterase domain